MRKSIVQLSNIALADLLKENKLILIAYGFFIIATVISFFVWIKPLFNEKKQLELQRAQELKLIEKYEKKLEGAKDLQKLLNKKKQEVEKLKKKLFPGKDPYELATRIEQVAQKNLSIRSYQITATKDYNLYKEVKFRFVLDTNIVGLYKLLKWINESAPYLVVKDINIRRISRGKAKSSLMVNLTLTALMQQKG